jgi:hypothetical protein
MITTLTELIQEVRKVLKERGWRQGSMMGGDGSVCLLGAIGAALNENEDFEVSYKFKDPLGTALLQVLNKDPMVARLTSHINESDYDKKLHRVWRFNDRIDNTLLDIEQLLDRTEQRLTA